MKDKKVFIIGNGFDISLGWKTKYSDFASNEDFWPFVNEKNGLAWYLGTKAKTEKWLDIESELLKYAKGQCFKEKEQVEKDFLAYKKLKIKLSEYLDKVQSGPIDKNSLAARIIFHIARNGKFRDIYTFNYTDLNSISKKLGCRNLSFKYVHGSLENNGIVLGVDDHENIDPVYDFLYKTFDRNYSSTPIQYSLQDADEVVFFGHSLGPTDYHYFKNFFLRQSQETMEFKDKVKITIFTWNDESRMEILRQLRNMNGNKSLALLFANNDLQIICTDNSDQHELDKINAFFSHLDKCSKESDQKHLEAFSSFLH